MRSASRIPEGVIDAKSHVPNDSPSRISLQLLKGQIMANTFGKDILIQAKDPQEAASFYVNHLGFEITDSNPQMVSLRGKNINLFIEPGPALGPVLEVTVPSVAEAKIR